MIALFIATGLIAFIVYALLNYIYDVKVKKLVGKHIVVTGGSSGIGKAVAILSAAKGAHVTIIARNKANLDEACKEVLGAAADPLTQKITALPMDVTQSYIETEKAINELEERVGPIYMLVNCAGSAECSTIKDASEENFRKMLNLNVMGTILPTKAVSQRMMEREEGIIVITTSLAALLGIYGMSAYCASKWALRGFAETLSQEVAPYNISVTMSLPPDTDTPGYEAENKDKPEETKKICQSGGLYSPEKVAEKLLSDAQKGNFWSAVGFEGTLLTLGSAGWSPLASFVEVFLQISFVSLVRIISIFVLRSNASIVTSLHSAKKTKKTVEQKEE